MEPSIWRISSDVVIIGDEEELVMAQVDATPQKGIVWGKNQ